MFNYVSNNAGSVSTTDRDCRFGGRWHWKWDRWTMMLHGSRYGVMGTFESWWKVGIGFDNLLCSIFVIVEIEVKSGVSKHVSPSR